MTQKYTVKVIGATDGISFEELLISMSDLIVETVVKAQRKDTERNQICHDSIEQDKVSHGGVGQ